MTQKKGALSGIKILDFTQYIAGPYATQIMCDLGASVIKVERPDRLVGAGPFVPYLDQTVEHYNPAGERVHDMCFNRGKRSITINMKNERQKELVRKLAKDADIIIENYFPGKAEEMGVGYEAMKKLNPTVIYVSVSGFGQNGPYAHRGAFDLIIQGMSGIMDLTGDPKGPPVNIGTSVADMTTALYATIATLAALNYRNRTGKGQFIDIAMLDCMLPFVESRLSEYVCTGVNPTRQGNGNGGHNVPVQGFPTKDGSIMITAARNPIFRKLCNSVGHPELADDPRFIDPEHRYQNREAVDQVFSDIFRTQTVDYWVKKLNEDGLACGPINRVCDLVEDPQVKARNMVVTVDNPNVGKFTQIGTPFKMSESPASADAYTEELGQSNYYVFHDLLGYSQEEIDDIFGGK